jgi:membrane protease YdiL (CAAX protease family)
MRGLLKTRPAWSQLLVVISIALVSLFVVGLLGTTILAKMAGMGLLEVSDTAKLDYSKPQTIFLLRGFQVVQFIALFIIPVFVCAWLFSTDTKKYLGLKAPSNKIHFVWGVAIMIVSIPLINFLGEINQQVKFPAELDGWMKKNEATAAKSIAALLSRHTLQDLLLNIVCIAGLAAVGEELLLRGMVQRLLIKMFKSPWAGIIIAAAVFSAMHVQFYGFLPRFLLGVFLGAAYWYSGSLWVPILGHFIYDALMILLTYLNPEMINNEDSVKIPSLAVAALVSAALTAVVIYRMKKDTTVNYSEVYADDAIPVKDHPF